MSKRALGRGLNTLLPPRAEYAAPVAAAPAMEPALPQELELEQIVPNPFQPRRHFAPAALQELAQSVRVDGIIQPVVVRRVHDHYQLISGERRWRAAKLAGLEKIPVHIQQLPDERMLEIALVENIQRENLDPIETARAFQRLSETLALSHEEIGERTGKDRVTISNSIRLLLLPEDVQELIVEGKISAGHARALLKLNDAAKIREVAGQIAANEWSVRHVEQLTAGLMAPAEEKKKVEPAPQDPNVRAAIEDLQRALGTKIRIVERAKGRGRLEIEFSSPEELDRIYSAIVRE